jgi:SAM-dependent methyltransferase
MLSDNLRVKIQKLRARFKAALRRLLGKPAITPLDKESAHEFWKNPEGANQPQDYVSAGRERGEFLLSLIEPYASAADSFLEIGCNAGRNLNHLLEAGYTNLNGIELNPDALATLRSTFPRLARTATLVNSPLEDVIQSLADNQYDIVFTMAVMVHIHSDSDWVFPHIARITGKYLVVVEAEQQLSSRHYARDYEKLFKQLGLKLVSSRPASHLKNMKHYIAYVFEKPNGWKLPEN